MVSRAAKLLGRRLYRDRSRTSCRPREMGWLVLGLRPSVENGVRSDSKEVCAEVCARHEVGMSFAGMSFARADGRGPAEMEVRAQEVRAHEGAHRGRSPQGIALAVAAIDEVSGELLERASFPQDRSGLRCLKRWAKRFPERRVGHWRTQEASVLTWRGGWLQPESRWWTCRRSFRRGCACSLASLATPATTTTSMPLPPRWPPRATGSWLAALDPEAASEVLRLLSERRLF